MKYPCDTVKDLLPLYHDDVCSGSSRRIVEEHLSECESCKETLERLNDETYNEQLREERDAVIGHYAKKSRRKSIVAGICVAAALAIPVLVSLIVNLATARALDWSVIVLTAIMTIGTPIVVPLLVEERRWLWTFASSVASLNLLFLTCCLFSGGRWFAVASLSSMLVLVSIFLPLVLHSLRLKKPFSRCKGLITMATDTVLLYALIAACGQYAKAGYWKPALIITTVCVLFAWAMLITIRYTKLRCLLKAGVSVAIGLALPAVVSMIVNLLTAQTLDWSLIVLAAMMTIGAPIVVPLAARKRRGLISMAAATVFLYALIAACGQYGNPDTYWRVALPIATGCAAFAWALFAGIKCMIKYSKKG